MKMLFLGLAVSATLHAQAQKPTGGCGFNVDLTSIPPASANYILYNRQPYTVKGIVHATGCEGAQGKVDVKLDGTLMGTQLNETDWDFSFAVPVEFDHIVNGTHSLLIVFTAGSGGGCYGSWETQMNVTIKDSVKTDSAHIDTAHTQDSIAVKPPVGGELGVYPVPASRSISIGRLRPTETGWQVTVTDSRGQAVPMPAGTLSNSVVTISTLHLPQGRYYLHFQTRERSVGQTIEILR